jgi:cytosine/adenosine deaminase-related metal-dependent hydrolase
LPFTATGWIKKIWLFFADLGVKVSHNPESSMKLAAGVAPVPEMLRHGIKLSESETDGCASNNDLDMFSRDGHNGKDS